MDGSPGARRSRTWRPGVSRWSTMKPTNDYVRQAAARRTKTCDHANPRPHRGVKSLAVSGVDRGLAARARPRNSENFFSPSRTSISAPGYEATDTGAIRRDRGQNVTRGSWLAEGECLFSAPPHSLTGRLFQSLPRNSGRGGYPTRVWV